MKAFNTGLVKDMQCAGFYFALPADGSGNFSWEKIILASYYIQGNNFLLSILDEVAIKVSVRMEVAISKMEFSFVIKQLGISH